MAPTSIPTELSPHWTCPDLRDYWQLARSANSEEVVLRSHDRTSQHIFSPPEGYALQYFIGSYAIAQIQQIVAERYPDAPKDLVARLLQKLVRSNVLRYEPDAIAATEILEDLPCPDLTSYWTLARSPQDDRVFLVAGDRKHAFDAAEGYALRYFNGKSTIARAQQACQQEFPHVAGNLVANLLQKLVGLGVLQRADDADDAKTNAGAKKAKSGLAFKPGVRWIRHPEHWILRNPEDVTFLQASDRDKRIIDEMGTVPPEAIAAKYGVSPDYVRYLLQALTATAMLQGTKPPKPRKPKKFHPFQLLFFRVPLWNPDRWLDRHIAGLRWIWTRSFAVGLTAFLIGSAIAGIRQHGEILHAGQQLLATGDNLFLPFALLTAFVITLHELGHAFTLKHFGGVVPQIGLLFMMLIPAAYTDTSDSYCLRRWQRILVVGAGVLVQFAIMAIALWLWNATNPESWLHGTSYLLMVAAGFTIALNLNPLAKFDGYYLASATTGLNNLRGRSFGLYGKLLAGKPLGEKARDAWILAFYAPFSLAYLWFVFGFLLYRLFDWSATNIPITAIGLLSVWALYYYWPERSK